MGGAVVIVVVYGTFANKSKFFEGNGTKIEKHHDVAT